MPAPTVETIAAWTNRLIHNHWHPSVCAEWHEWDLTKGTAAVMLTYVLSSTEFIARGMGTIPADQHITILPVAPPPEEVAAYDADTRAIYDGEQRAITLFIAHCEHDKPLFLRLINEQFEGDVDTVSERLAYTMAGILSLQHTAFHTILSDGVAVPRGMEGRAREVIEAHLAHMADIDSLPTTTDGRGQ